jgi:LacI family transcriptional regulator
MTATRAAVAELAKVSPALVSYVTNGGPRAVSAEARARIELAIETLGYTPNPVAQALKGLATRTIGLLVPNVMNLYFGELTDEIERQLFERGNVLTIGATNDDRERELAFVDALVAHRVDGIMITSSRAAEIVSALAKEKIAAIVIDRVPENLDVSTISTDNRNGAREAVAHLQLHGHRLIGCIGGRIGTDSADERVAGWREQQQASGYPASDQLVRRSDFTEFDGYTSAMQLLRETAIQGKRPTALFVSSDIQAAGVLKACYELGLKVPSDVAVVSFDGTAASAFAVPPLTSFRQPVEQIARAAVENLLAQIDSPTRSSEHLVIPGTLRMGDSCGCRAD